MGGKKAESKPLFPDVKWWKDSPVKGKIGDNGDDDNDLRDNVSSNGVGVDYGSFPSFSSFEPIANDDDEDAEPSFLIDKLVPGFPECLVPGFPECLVGGNKEHRNHQLDVPSDISNQSSRGSDCSEGDISSNDSSAYEDEIEQPHRSLGLIFFDFLRFVAIGINLRCINTQIVPVFLVWYRMDLLHIALRIFMALFSLLLILVEFPDLFPFLNHGPNSSTSPPPPPLYIINWIPRGIFYMFLSTICFEQSIVVRAQDAVRHASNSSRFFDGIFIVMSAWFMMVAGVAYILLGLFCVQRVMERVRKDEKEKWKEYYEKVKQIELETHEAEEREWLLENGGEDEEGGHDSTTTGGGGRRCWQILKRWRSGCKHRQYRGGGFCYQLGCRGVDWRC